LGYLVKPFQRSELQANIEIALDAHRGTRRSTERYQRLADVLSAVILGIISVDQKEIVVMLNSTAENLTGWRQREAVGRQIRQVFRLVDAATGLPVDLPLEQVLRQGPLTEFSDAMLLAKDGESNPVSGSMAPVRKVGGRPAGAVILFESVPPCSSNPYLKVAAKQRGTEATLTFGRLHLVAASESMKLLLSYALRAARSEIASLLLEGETGTGKDVLAQFIHHSSSRRTGPFIPVNCSAIPETLLESELFGHEQGAYTDARAAKKGLFEAADGGTLFLDEIGDMSTQMQAKLLRAVEEKSFRRLGGLQDIEVDVRIVAATNRDLAAAVRGGRFRTDLYHRLSVIEIVIPPLRERRDDILPLAEHFLSLHRRQLAFSPKAVSRLMSHDWPGNARELRNVVERAAVLQDGDVIDASDIEFTMARPASEPAAPRSDLSLASVEREAIERALAQSHGNQTAAAALLGITRDVLRHRMKRFELLKPPAIRRLK
jgi:PAS domain S-box-containing protein